VHSTARGTGFQPVRERLRDGQVQAILKRFRAGETKGKLAAEYGISLSSVKRLLRSHRP
jgi:hypothetical protein